MGVLSGPRMLEELIRAKIPGEWTIESNYVPSIMSTKFTWTRADGKQAVLDMGDEEFRKLSYPETMAQAIVDVVKSQFEYSDGVNADA